MKATSKENGIRGREAKNITHPTGQTKWHQMSRKQRQVEKKRRNGRYTPEFKQYAVERMRVAVNIAALAKELGVPRVLLYRWRQRLDPLWWQSTDKGESFVPPDREKFSLQQQLRQAKQLLAEKTLEVDFFRGALQKIAARRQKNASVGGTASTSKSER